MIYITSTAHSQPVGKTGNTEVKTPDHIAFIPDGNRRWAKQRGLDVIKGHEAGIELIGEVLKWCKEHNIHTATFWGFSTENKNRTNEEVEGLMRLFETKLMEILQRAQKEKEAGNESKYPKVSIKFYGMIDDLPQRLQEYIKRAEKESSKNGEYRVNFLLNYGGKPEIIDCIHKVAEDYKKGIITEINEEEIMKRLWTGDLQPPDLIIRTSGEYRLSGLLPLQSAYSELFFVDKYWPDFSKEDFEKILKEYSKRERRFGK
ncbi:MAG: polyprenyl diphosphate synthase [Candidatus Micrarchaeia archaeon]